jgi:hypothetical protein
MKVKQVVPEIIPGYYDTPGIMKLFDLTRAGVSNLARREGWTVYPVGNGQAHLFPADEVLATLEERSTKAKVGAGKITINNCFL